jgi:hypothetical protein
MKLLKLIKSTITLATILGIAGCSIAPQQQARINQCSIEANANSASTRVGNSAYWSCLDRLENAQARQEKMLQQRAYLNNLQTRCESFGFKRNTNEFSSCMMLQKQQDDNIAIQEAQLREQAADRQRKALRDMNDALKPQWIPNQCPGMLNAKPGQYGTGC